MNLARAALTDKANPSLGADGIGIAKGRALKTRAILTSFLIAGSAIFYGWPFEFRLPLYSVPNGATYDEDGALTFDSPGIVVDRAGGRLLYEHLKDRKKISVVAVAETHGIDQVGPARLVSQSADPFNRNFTLGQHGDSLIFRLRVPATGNNGIVPELRARGAFREDRQQLLVATYDGGRVRLYVDGRLRDETSLQGGALRDWDPRYPLFFGNEATGTRPWLGRLHEVAIYDTALSPRRVASLSVASLEVDTSDRIYSLRSRCLSHESVPHLETGTAVLGSCQIPSLLKIRHASEMLFFKLRQPSDYVHAIVVWVPIGIALRASLASWSSGLVIFIIGSWAALLESIQLFLPARSSSLLDLVAAVAAGCVGAFIGRRMSGNLHARTHS